MELKAVVLGLALLPGVAFAQSQPLRSMGTEETRNLIAAMGLAGAYRQIHWEEHPTNDQIEKFVNDILAREGAKFRYNAKTNSVFVE